MQMAGSKGWPKKLSQWANHGATAKQQLARGTEFDLCNIGRLESFAGKQTR